MANFVGGSGDDTFPGGPSVDSYNGGAGIDTVTYINSTAGISVFLFGAPDWHTGDAAGDSFTSIENIIGTNFADALYGNSDSNRLFGMGGNDLLFGGFGGENFLFGGDGDDWLVGGAGIDHMDGGAGENYISYQLSSAGVTASLLNPSINTGDAAGDTYANAHSLTGSDHDDVLWGDDSGAVNQLWGLKGNNVLHGAKGYTTFISGPNADTMIGGLGRGMIDYEVDTAGVVASIADPSINQGEARGDTYSNIWDIAGGQGNDILHGDGNQNNMLGLRGDDVMYGHAGSDTLTGDSGSFSQAPGADTLHGGAASDWFVMNDLAITASQAGKFDRIMDFNQGNSGAYDVNEFDAVNLSQVSAISAAFRSGAAINSMVRILEDASHTFSEFQVNISGSWLTIARMDGIRGNHTVRVIFDDAQPVGSSVTVQSSTGPTAINFGSMGSWVISGAGHFNADGDSDILLRNIFDGAVHTSLLQNGQLIGSGAVGQLVGGWQLAGIGDFNQDGSSDVLLRNANTGEVNTWIVKNGQWSASGAVGVLVGGWQLAGTGDFNNDGTSDVLLRNANTAEVNTWIVKNGQWSASGAVGVLTGAWQAIGTGDFNNDGTTDVLLHNTATNEVNAWIVQNGQWAASTACGVLSGTWQVKGTGDFNGDGTDDVLLHNTSTGEVAAWLLQNGSWTASASIGTFETASNVAAIGDFNNDGTSDLFWQNPSNGNAVEWLLNA